MTDEITTVNDDMLDSTCEMREDGMHCNCWFDDCACCACGEGGGEQASNTTK